MSNPESKVYQKFFLRNKYHLVCPSLLFVLIGAYLYFIQKPLYQVSELWQIDNSSDMESQVVLADEAVSVLRNNLIQSKLGLNNHSKSNVFKISPFSISVNVSNPSNLQAELDLEKVSTYLTNNYPSQKLVEKQVMERKTSPWLFIGIGFLAGISLGLLTSLVRTYLRNY